MRRSEVECESAYESYELGFHPAWIEAATEPKLETFVSCLRCLKIGA